MSAGAAAKSERASAAGGEECAAAAAERRRPGLLSAGVGRVGGMEGRGAHKRGGRPASASVFRSPLKMLATIVLVAAAVGLLLVAVGLRRTRGLKVPGPRPWPLLGNLALLGGHASPFHAFSRLAEKFGDVYRLRLGASECLVVNTFPLIKEVLITKGGHFGGRPDFIRFHQLFGGDRDNCESKLQKKTIFLVLFYFPSTASTWAPNLLNFDLQQSTEQIRTQRKETRKDKLIFRKNVNNFNLCFLLNFVYLGFI